MASVVTHETLLFYTENKARLLDEINRLQSEKILATYSQGDARAIKAQDEEAVRQFFRDLYDGDEELQGKYKDFTQIPDFENEIDKIAAKYQDELDRLNAWETSLDAQITTDSAELEETNAYIDFVKSTLSSNIQDEYNYGLK